MNLRTIVNADPSPEKITYNDPVFLIGSCFSDYIGEKFSSGFMPVMANPYGTVFNPVSVAQAIRCIVDGKEFRKDDLVGFNGRYISFDHSTEFSDQDAGEVLSRINEANDSAGKFIRSARYLFVTFGTGRVYRYSGTGRIVANCHKMPQSEFTQELLDPDVIVEEWSEIIGRLSSICPNLNIIFTVSPVRHWKDGPFGNQLDKAVLFVAINELLKKFSRTAYFPSYEILMDDLRDYRFYNSDMLHPSPVAIDYIWEKFSECYFSDETTVLWTNAGEIRRAMQHRIREKGSPETRKFADTMLGKIRFLQSKIPTVDLSEALEWFSKM